MSATKLNPATTDIPEPAVTLDTGGQCQSAAIESPVVAPVIADNLFPHTQAEAIAGKVYETDIQLPATATGDATLQVLEFMAPHAPQWYVPSSFMLCRTSNRRTGFFGLVVS